MKVRCSNGLTVSAYAGNFNHRIPAEIYLPAVDCDKAILVHLKHEDKLIDNTEACLQVSLPYPLCVLHVFVCTVKCMQCIKYPRAS